MILTLRQRHRRFLIALGVVLPVVFAWGIVARRFESRVGGRLPALSSDTEKFPFVLSERPDLFAKTAVRVRILRGEKASGSVALALSTKDFLKPDLLVYWSAEIADGSESLPEDAVLLGSFHSIALRIPDRIVGANGVLVLYSLADGEVVDTSRSFRFDGSTLNVSGK